MNIIAFDKSTSSSGGGAEISNFQVLTSLRARGHRILLCYENAGDFLPLYKANGIAVMRVTHTHLRREGARTIANGLLMLWDLLRLHCAVMRFGADVLYWNVIQATPIGALLARSTGLPLVVHVRTFLDASLSRQFRFGLAGATLSLANSNATAGSVSAINSNLRTRTIYNGIDLSTFTPAATQFDGHRPFKILFVGRVGPVKGVHLILDALDVIAAGADRIELSICGSTATGEESYLASLKRRALDVPAKIAFLGHRADVANLIRNHDLVVVPSIWQEAFGRILVEAMACGRPVIASRVGGMPEVLGDDLRRYLFTPGDPHDLALRIRDVLAEYESGCVPATLLRTRAEVFSLDKTIVHVERALREACETK